VKLTPTLTLTLTLSVMGCSILQKPKPIIQVDTVTVTKEVPAPLPTGDSVEICLSTGMPVTVLVTSGGDTLVGPERVKLTAVRPVLSFQGAYANGQSWFERGDTIRFEKRVYRKLSRPRKRACDELKQVGDYRGLPVFAEVTAPQPLPGIEIPVVPGVFQTYTTPVPRRRR
jgi:hypothetical protein